MKIKEKVLGTGDKQTKTGKDTRFKKGVSGNPKGRPKMTEEQKDALQMLKALAVPAVEKMNEMLHDPETPAAVKIKIITVILDRTYGSVIPAEDSIDKSITIKFSGGEDYGD